ncbi:MAG: hypothetical protein PHY83_02055 [Bacilli bacterium]|nr:hypothetical protein [Bacilli bacterium]
MFKKTDLVRLQDSFDQLWSKIALGENFALFRYGDGERAIMTGRQIKGVDGWRSPDYITELSQALNKTLAMSDSKIYQGISCPCCDEAAYFWFKDHIKSRNITFANLFVNINYQKFIQEFDRLQRDTVVIANHRAVGKKIGNLNILKYYSVTDDCFSFWDNGFNELIKQIKNDFGKVNNLFYVVSAGPLSEPIIAELFKNNPENTYIDFGSSIDKYIHDKDNRFYTNPKSKYGRRNCWMLNPNNNDSSDHKLYLKYRYYQLRLAEVFRKIFTV